MNNIEMIIKKYSKHSKIKIPTKNIFVGDIKKCYDIRSYKEYGDYKKIEDINERRMKNSSFDYFTDVVREHVVLIKIGKNEYVDASKVSDVIDLQMPASWKLFYTFPLKNYDNFVDEKSLRPFFFKEEKVPKKMTIDEISDLISNLKDKPKTKKKN